MIIDVHVHTRLGPDPHGFAYLLEQAEALDVTLCVNSLSPKDGAGMPQSPTEDEIRGCNDWTAELAAAHPERIIPMWYLNPAHGDFACRELEERVAAHAGLQGVKLWVAVRCNDPRLDPIMRLCAEHKLPVLQHTWRAATAMFKRSLQEVLVHPDCGIAHDDFHGVTEGELMRILRGEQERLGLEGAADLLQGVQRRRLYKVASFIFPGERKERLLHYLYDLYQHPDKRRSKEIELSRLFGERLKRRMNGSEILIDIPRFDKSPEVDLKVFFGDAAPSGKADPLAFEDPEVSRLRESLLDNFEDQAKIFRIFCVEEEDLLAVARDQVKRHLN